VRTRIDWKSVLSLELTDKGVDFSVLSEFRSRLLTHEAERRLFDGLLEHCRNRGWIKARGKQRTDATHVLAAIRTLRRLECVGETMRHVLSGVAPSWLLEHMDPAWAERYEKRFSDFRLPKDEKKRVELMVASFSNGCMPRSSSPGYENSMPSKRCGRCGSSTLMPTCKTLRGA
jgi:transposase